MPLPRLTGLPAARPASPDGRPAVSSVEQLLEGARRREPRATHAFVLAIAPTILSAVRQVIGAHHPDVEDVAQDAVMNLLDALGGFRQECSIKHFVCRIATHRALAARRHAHYREVWTPSAAPEEIEAAADADAALDRPDAVTVARRRQAVRALLDELPAVQAEAVALYFMMGLTADEVAQATATPVPTVRSRLRLAREALLQRIAGSAQLTAELGGPASRDD